MGNTDSNMSKVDSFQPVTGLKDTTSAIGKVQRPKYITGVGAGLTGLARKLFLLPITITGGSLWLVTGSFGLSFWVAGGVLSYWQSMIGFTSSDRNRKPSSTPPVSASVSTVAEASEAIDFLPEFESRYGLIHPNFVHGRFMNAVEQCRRECKLLFVFLHSPEHPDTPSFCTETLCSEILSAFVNDNFVSWGDSIWEKEGIEISKMLKASRFPFWGVIKATTGEGFSLLRQFEGPSSPEEMVTELQRVLEESGPTLVEVIVDSNDEYTNDPPLMEEQDAPNGTTLANYQFEGTSSHEEIVTVEENAPTLIAASVDTNNEHTNIWPSMEEQITSSSSEEMVTQLQTIFEENASVLVPASIDINDEHTNNPSLMEEQDTPSSSSPEEMVLESQTVFEASFDTNDEHTNYPSLMEEQDTPSLHEEMVTELHTVFEENVSALVASVYTNDEHTNYPTLMEEEDTPSLPEEMVTELHIVFEENASALVATSVDTNDENMSNPPVMEEQDIALTEEQDMPSSTEEMVTQLPTDLEENVSVLVAARDTTNDEFIDNPLLIEEQDTPSSPKELVTELQNVEENASVLVTTSVSTYDEHNDKPTLVEEEDTPSSPEEVVTELQTGLEENSPILVVASANTNEEHTNNPPLMEEQDTPSSTEEMVTELQTVVGENASVLVTSVSTNDEHTDNPTLVEEEDTPSSPEEMVIELQNVLEENASVLIAASVSTNDEHTNNPSLIEEQDTTSSTEEMVTELQTVLEENVSVLVTTNVSTNDDHTNNLTLMEEQDNPFGVSLETDQGNEYQTGVDRNVIETEAESEANVLEEAEPEPEVIQVFVRLPTGQRIGREFLCTDTLQSVYELVDSTGILDVGSYTLANFFPRVLYGQNQLSSTLEELGLNPQSGLFVELNW